MNTDRIKEIQKDTAYPDSISVQQALLKVWNECEQAKESIPKKRFANGGLVNQSIIFSKRMQGESLYLTFNKWDIRFIELATFISDWSKDPSTKVGAVIIDGSHRILSVGFNGYPQHIPDDDLHDRERKYAKIIHAEMNALLFAQRNMSGCTIYVYPMAPCSQCASAIIQSGIERVVTRKCTSEQYERWGDKIKLTEEMFESANIELVYI